VLGSPAQGCRPLPAPLCASSNDIADGDPTASMPGSVRKRKQLGNLGFMEGGHALTDPDNEDCETTGSHHLIEASSKAVYHPLASTGSSGSTGLPPSSSRQEPAPMDEECEFVAESEEYTAAGYQQQREPGGVGFSDARGLRSPSPAGAAPRFRSASSASGQLAASGGGGALAKADVGGDNLSDSGREGHGETRRRRDVMTAAAADLVLGCSAAPRPARLLRDIARARNGAELLETSSSRSASLPPGCECSGTDGGAGDPTEMFQGARQAALNLWSPQAAAVAPTAAMSSGAGRLPLLQHMASRGLRSPALDVSAVGTRAGSAPLRLLAARVPPRTPPPLPNTEDWGEPRARPPKLRGSVGAASGVTREVAPLDHGMSAARGGVPLRSLAMRRPTVPPRKLAPLPL